MTTPPTPDWDEFRRQMPASEHWAYFDHAAVAPLSGPARDVYREWTEDAADNGGVYWSKWRKKLEDTRGAAARLINAKRDDVALIHNTTEGVTLVAEGFPWRRGDNVVLPAEQFPSNLYPWLNLADRGVETRSVPTENERLDLDRIAAACDARTRVIAVSWVGYATGYRCDLRALADLAHRREAFLFVDAIQGLGGFPLDVAETGVDALAADGHKWLLGPEGAGIFFAAEKLREVLRPFGVGWNSVRHAGDFTRADLDLKPHAGRYEGGSYNMGGLAALGASVEFLLSAGIEQVGRRILEVTDDVVDRLIALGADVVSDRSPEHASGIVSFQIPGRDSRQIQQHCRGVGVIVNCRQGRVRLSPHAYANQDDAEQLIEALKSVP